MSLRFPFFTALMALCCWIIVLIPLSSAVRADALTMPNKVSLILEQPTTERLQREIFFKCTVALENATGKDLSVRSSYFSAFDGLEIVITTPEGRTLIQQGYAHHQSPFTFRGREFIAKNGSTTQTLVFPVSGLPKDLKMVRVRLVGTLPGSTFTRILSTETFDVKIGN